MRNIFIASALFFSVVSHSSMGQTTTAPAKSDSSGKDEKYTIASVSGLSNNNTGTLPFSLDDYLVVTLKDNIGSLFTLHKQETLMLWIDNIPFPNLKIWRANISNKQLIFLLQVDSVKNSSWNYFYGYNHRKVSGKGVKVNIQVGTATTCLTDSVTIILKTTECWMMWTGYVAIIGIIGFALWLIFFKRILRDNLIFDATVKIIKGVVKDPAVEVSLKDIPFSLARSQLIFWIVLVSASILYVWLNTDEFIPITTSVASLIGISGGTSVISKIIESNTISKTQLTATQFNTKYKSQTFLPDILSDENGFSISRVQMFIFTIIIGFYFCWHVIYYLQMPVFSDGLLLLMGVSNSTYAGVKLSEKTG